MFPKKEKENKIQIGIFYVISKASNNFISFMGIRFITKQFLVFFFPMGKKFTEEKTHGPENVGIKILTIVNHFDISNIKALSFVR